jgi:NTP pyrophosphatase (non-canonical NTP hydrolase)
VNLNEYQEKAQNTAPELSMAEDALAVRPGILHLLRASMGISGEAGEITEHLKKVVFQGHELDRALLLKEVGDVLWYVADMAEAIGVPLEDIAYTNLALLHHRYGEKFSRGCSTIRDLAGEQELLDQHMKEAWTREQ